MASISRPPLAVPFFSVLIAFVLCGWSLVQGAWRVSVPAISGAFGPVWIAAEEGLFKKYGLDAEVVYIRGATQTTAAFLSGEVQVGATGGDGVVAAYRASNRDLAIIGAVSNKLVLSMMAHASVRTPSDLKGKTVAISRFGGIVDFGARYILLRSGLEPGKDVSLIQAGGVPEVIAVMEKGLAQAGVMSPPTTLKATQLGYRELADLAQADFPYASIVLIARRQLLRERAPLVESFLKAYSEGAALYRKDKSLAFRVLSKYTKTNDEKVLEETYRAYALGAIPRVPVVPQEALQNVIDSRKEPDRPGLAPLRAEDILDMGLLLKLQREGFFETLPR